MSWLLDCAIELLPTDPLGRLWLGMTACLIVYLIVVMVKDRRDR